MQFYPRPKFTDKEKLELVEAIMQCGQKPDSKSLKLQKALDHFYKTAKFVSTPERVKN